MNTTTSTVLAGSVVAAGHWSQGKSIPIRVFVGIGVTAIALAAISEGNANLGEQFGHLLIAAALMFYAIPLSAAIRKATGT